MMVLLQLAEHSGTLVQRQQLIDQVWQGNEFVGNKALSNIIWQIRKILANAHPEQAETIETISKEGYRLLLPVEQLKPQATPDNTTAPSNKRFVILGVLSCLIILAFVIMLSETSQQSHGPVIHTFDSHELVRVTDEDGVETYPKLSADGAMLAYIWSGAEGRYGLYVKSLASPQSKRLIVESHSPLQSPDWSPNGEELVYSRQSENGDCELYRVNVATKSTQLLSSCASNFTGSHSWSHNGQWIAFAKGKSTSDEPGGIFLYNTRNNTTEQITFSGPQEYLPFDLSWSPNDDVLAYTKMSSITENEIFVLKLGDKPRQLTFEKAKVRGHTWAQGGKTIIFASNPKGKWALWQINVATGEIKPLGKQGKYFYPNYSADGQKLVFEQRSSTVNISKIQLHSGFIAKASTPFIESIGSDSDLNYGKTSGKLVFNSNRSGIRGIWLGQIGQKEVTQLGEANTEANYPVLSPSAKQVAYVSLGADKRFDQIFIVDVQTNQTRQLTKDLLPHLNPVWASDGQGIYSSAPINSVWNIWYYGLNGEPPRQITQNGGIYAQQSANGQTLYFTRFKQSGIWQLNLNSGEESLLVDSEYDNIQGNWILTDKGIYFFDRNSQNDLIKFYDSQSLKVSTVAELALKSVKNSVLAYLPEQSSLLYTHQGKHQGDIMLLQQP